MSPLSSVFPPHLVLAPMEGATDFAMRQLLTGLGGIDLCVSEFIRVSGLVPPAHVFRRYIPEIANGWKTRSGTTLFPQLLGGSEERMAKAAEKLASMGAPGIDINFGCPSKTVNRNDGGSCLLQYPDRIYGIVKAVRCIVPMPIPVSVKIRLGWENPRDVFHNARLIEKAGATWLTVHARTKFEAYQNHAHWDILHELNSEIGIPLIANGDITSADEFKRCRELTGCKHFMIGRGALRDPYIFQKIRGHHPNEENLPQLLWEFIRTSRATHPAPNREVGRIKQFVRLMGQRDEAMGEFFESIKRVTRSEELDRVFQDFFAPAGKSYLSG